MIQLLLFMFPAGLSLKMKDEFFKEKLEIKDYVLMYVKYALAINFIVFAVLFIYSNGVDSSISYAMDNIGFIFKYLSLGIVSAILVPILDEYIKKNISVKIDFKTMKDKNDKKKK